MSQKKIILLNIFNILNIQMVSIIAPNIYSVLPVDFLTILTRKYFPNSTKNILTLTKNIPGIKSGDPLLAGRVH